jgi:hypothetical protein
MSSGMLRRVVWLKLTDVSEVLTVFIKAMMESVNTSETAVNARLQGVTSSKTVIFILVAVRTLKLITNQ